MEIDKQYLDGDVPQASAFDDFGFGSFGDFSRTSGSTSTGKWAPNYGRPAAPVQRPQQSPKPAYRQPSAPATPARPVPKGPSARHTPSSDFKPDNPGDIRVGMRVEHNIFGYGTILSLEGSGGDAKAEFRTDGGEIKKLILKYAKLRICKD